MRDCGIADVMADVGEKVSRGGACLCGYPRRQAESAEERKNDECEMTNDELGGAKLSLPVRVRTQTGERAAVQGVETGVGESVGQ